jgi:hypothetical protein
VLLGVDEAVPVATSADVDEAVAVAVVERTSPLLALELVDGDAESENSVLVVVLERVEDSVGTVDKVADCCEATQTQGKRRCQERSVMRVTLSHVPCFPSPPHVAYMVRLAHSNTLIAQI